MPYSCIGNTYRYPIHLCLRVNPRAERRDIVCLLVTDARAPVFRSCHCVFLSPNRNAFYYLVLLFECPFSNSHPRGGRIFLSTGVPCPTQVGSGQRRMEGKVLRPPPSLPTIGSEPPPPTSLPNAIPPPRLRERVLSIYSDALHLERLRKFVGAIWPLRQACDAFRG